jgi:hypothetical protein
MSETGKGLKATAEAFVTAPLSGRHRLILTDNFPPLCTLFFRFYRAIKRYSVMWCNLTEVPAKGDVL